MFSVGQLQAETIGRPGLSGLCISSEELGSGKMTFEILIGRSLLYFNNFISHFDHSKPGAHV